MSTNISCEKREILINEINQLKSFIEQNAKDKNATRLISYLGDLFREVNGKKYGLVFEEHREKIDEILEQNAPVFTEEKDLFIDGGGELNFLLEGDNLASLKLLEKTHRGKIDVIYIDPPYNTGKEDFIYDDNYISKEDTFQHSKWLSFIKKRLEIARALLRDNGVILISIDDNECATLKLMCDEIFGEDNRQSIHHIQVRYENKSLNEKKAFQEVCEYVLIYEKKNGLFDANRPTEEYSIEPFCFEIKEGKEFLEERIGNKNVKIFKKGNYEIIKHTEGNIKYLKTTWASGSVVKGNASGKYFETFLKPRKGIDGLSTLYKVEGIGEDGLGFRYFLGPNKPNATQGVFFSGIPMTRLEELNKGSSLKYKTISNLYDFSPDFGNIRSEGGVPFGSGKKPVKMLKQFINYHKGKDITVLDFFAGSGSTGHATLALNEEDGGSRKFILCTNNENNICHDITYQRIRNVITKDGLPGSLKYFKTDFIPITEKMYYEYADELLLHVRELVELENAINFDKDNTVAIVLDDEEMEDFVKKIVDESTHPSTSSATASGSTKTLYMGHDVLLSSKQERILKAHNITVNVIPDYYYRDLAL